MSNNSRREFMIAAGSMAVGTAAASLPAAEPAPPAKPAGASPGKPTLVVVYLRGGADTLSLTIPYADPFYPQHRKTLGVPGPDDKSEKKTLLLDKTFGLNPNARELHALYGQGRCVPVVCTGSPHPTRSHFEAQDYMERAATGQLNITEGWLNRYLSATASGADSPLRAFAFQSVLARSLRGSYPVLAVPPKTTSDAAIGAFESMYANAGSQSPPDLRGMAAGRAIKQAGISTIVQLRRLQQVLATPEANPGKYPAGGFGQQMKDIAKIIKANVGLEVTAVDHHSWDDHVDLGPVEGNFAKRIAEVSAVIGAFVEDLGPAFSRTLVLVMSEFSRTVAENGTKGTDHGHGCTMLAVGGMLNGGRVLGKWTGLDPKNLYENRDLPVHTDFRVIFAETLQKLFGFDAQKAGYFPQYTLDQPPLELLRQL